jgi:glycosyltransferase involved in cell wall biosynthesis
MEANVILPGVLTKDEFLGYLKKSRGFVQHSVTALNGDQEGTPVAIMEASAAGLPVIATLHAGIPDVIIDGTTGFLVDEHDVDGMAEKMTLLLENKTLAKQLGNSGKERMKSHFLLQKHLDVIDNLVEKTIRSNE